MGKIIRLQTTESARNDAGYNLANTHSLRVFAHNNFPQLRLKETQVIHPYTLAPLLQSFTIYNRARYKSTSHNKKG